MSLSRIGVGVGFFFSGFGQRASNKIHLSNRRALQGNKKSTRNKA
jgi:hypothetical protein